MRLAGRFGPPAAPGPTPSQADTSLEARSARHGRIARPAPVTNARTFGRRVLGWLLFSIVVFLDRPSGSAWRPSNPRRLLERPGEPLSALDSRRELQRRRLAVIECSVDRVGSRPIVNRESSSDEKRARRPVSSRLSPDRGRSACGSFVSELSSEELSGSLGSAPQGSSAFFCEIKRRTRSARSAPSNGFLNASLNPSAKVSSPGSSLVKASRIVPMMIGALAKILRDLTGFDAAQGHVDDDAVGMEALGTDSRLESRSRRLDPEIVGLAKMVTKNRLERAIGPDHQYLMINLGFEVAQGHSVLLEEPQEMLPRDATILRAGDAITTQAA